jgi:hypothetical protein
MPTASSAAASQETGAPETERTLTPAMFALPGARSRTATPDQPPALVAAFDDWRSRNAYALEDGGCGDVVELLRVLVEAARPKA